MQFMQTKTTALYSQSSVYLVAHPAMQGPKLPGSRYQREGVGQAVTGMLQIHLITELLIPGLSLTHLSPSFLFIRFVR